MAEAIYSDALTDAPFLKGAVVKFIDILPQRIREMEAALADGRLEALASVAHRIKGAGGTHGFPVVTERARALEGAARAGEAARTESLLKELVALSQRLVAEPPP